MSQLLTEWVDTVFFKRPRSMAGSADTRTDYRCTARQLDRYAQDALGRGAVVEDLSLGFLTGWLSSISGTVDQGAVIRGASAGCRKRSAATINHKLRSAMALWRYAAKLGQAEPVQAVEKVAEDARIPLAWTQAELMQLVRYVHKLPGCVGAVPASVWWESLYRVDHCTGERIDALMRCPVSGLDLHTGVLIVPAALRKDRHDARYELLPKAVAALQLLGVQNRLATIFGDWPFDARGEWETLRRHYRRHQVAAGLYATDADIPPRVSGFHRIRRTTASYMAKEKGIPYAQGYLQHSSPAVTRRYLDPRIVGSLTARGVLQDLDDRPVQLRLFEDEMEVA